MPAPFRLSRRWRPLVGRAWVVLTVVALGAALYARRDAATAAASALTPVELSAAAVAALVAVALSGALWRSLLRSVGIRLPALTAARVFFVSQLGKYLPGAVWPVVAQVELARAAHVPRRVSAAAALLFLWTHLVTAAVVAVIGLSATGHLPGAAVLLVLPLLALLTPTVIATVLERGLRVFRRQPLPVRPSAPGILVSLLWAAAMWLGYGVHLVLLANGTGGRLPLAGAAATFAAAWVAGFVVAVAPAGAGAREAALVALLLPALGSGPALTVALLSRVSITLADLLWGLLGVVAPRLNGARPTAGSTAAATPPRESPRPR